MIQAIVRFALKKETLFCACMTALTVGAAMRESVDADALLPMLIVHSCILINTYFSVRLFADIQPRGYVQGTMDTLLGALYLWMTFSLGNPIMYAASVTVMFAVATLKYVLMMGKIPHPELLIHKVKVDILGMVGSASPLVLFFLGYEVQLLWAWAIGFLAIQADIFFFNPLYVFHAKR